MINKLFQPLYSDNESERYLVEVASMEHPIFDYGFPPDGPSDSMLKSAQQDYMIRCDEYDTHISQLKKYPAPWLTANMKEPMELGKDFKEQYQWTIGWKVSDNEVWVNCTEEEYNTPVIDPSDKRRIIAVPISGIEEGDLWENVIAIATTFEYGNSLNLLKSKYSISKL